MADYKDIVKLAVDAHKGSVEKYSAGESAETLRKALVDLNGGSSVLNYRSIRDGKCAGLFSIIEETIDRVTVDGLKESDFFNTMVDYRNLATGDQNKFIVDDANLFVVDTIARGAKVARRQRLLGQTEVSIKTTTKAVRFYEELSRVLAGRVDFNHLIDIVSRSFSQKILEEVLAAWDGITSSDLGGAAYYVSGSFSETNFLDLVAHVEASADTEATIVGTKKALRSIASAIQTPADSYKEDLYNFGYIGRYYGTPVVAIPQRHKANTTTFAYSDTTISVVASPEKPIKFVYEGDPLIEQGNATDNADLTQEYFITNRWGTGIVVPSNGVGIGKYVITA